MANMFSRYEQKRIPKNFEDCIQTDGVSYNLWTWVRRVETLGKILCVIVIIAGVIISVKSGFTTVQDLTKYDRYGAHYTSRTEFNPLTFFILLIAWTLGAFLEYFACHILALLIGSLASIVQNTKISADVALLQFQNKAKTYGIDSPDKTDSLPSEQFF